MGPTVKQWFKQRSRVITDSYVERYMYSHTAYSIRHMVCAVVCLRQCEFDIKCLHCANTFVNEAVSATRSADTERALYREASAPQRIDGNWFLLLRKIRNRSHPCHRIRCRVIRMRLSRIRLAHCALSEFLSSGRARWFYAKGLGSKAALNCRLTRVLHHQQRICCLTLRTRMLRRTHTHTHTPLTKPHFHAHSPELRQTIGCGSLSCFADYPSNKNNCTLISQQWKIINGPQPSSTSSDFNFAVAVAFSLGVLTCWRPSAPCSCRLVLSALGRIIRTY